MTTQDVLRVLEEVLELAPRTLTGRERLRDLEAWDSLSTMLFIARADAVFGVPLQGERVFRCRTVEELVRLLGPDAADRAA
jgi:acyl carrier protein